VQIGIDLFGDAVTWASLGQAATTVLCLTHGHPEHCGSMRRFLSSANAPLVATHLVSSAPVVDHVTRGIALPAANAHRVKAGERVSIDGASIAVFEWRHMPLLPPGARAKASYAAHVLSRPIEFARVASSGLRLPMRAPMLGFHITFPDGRSVLNYAEGLHRLTDPREAESVASRLPADVLMFAVEPDDVDAIPRWIEMLRPAEVFLYEAHRPWREVFGLPYVDLGVYTAGLSARFGRVRFDSLSRPGQREVVCD
jgi:hypothetical protein